MTAALSNDGYRRLSWRLVNVTPALASLSRRDALCSPIAEFANRAGDRLSERPANCSLGNAGLSPRTAQVECTAVRQPWLTLCITTLVFAAIGCGGSTTAPSTTSVALHGEVSDPLGDTLSDPRVPVPPDLVHATADVLAGNITFVVQLAPGTLDRQTTRVTILLDTDQDPSTGIRQQDGIGADYDIDLAASTSQAAITKADQAGCAAHLSCFNAVGSAPITFVADSMQVTVALSLLGNASGRMSFQLSSYVLVAPLTPVIFDWMPDNNLPPGRVQ
jgi:hypothetical protein